MIIENISDLFEHKGRFFIAEKDEEINKVDRGLIINKFEKTGVIIFRNFNIKPTDVIAFTDKFTELYAADAPRRQNIDGQKNLNTVDEGFHEMPLHSEASYSPSWPELVWFYCDIPPTKGGNTTLCDGVKLWKELPHDLKDYFLAHPLCFDLEFPVIKKVPSRKPKPWLLNSVGSANASLDWNSGNLKVKQTRFAVNESRIPEVLSFVNHLLIIFKNEPQILKMTDSKGHKIPQEVIEKVHEISHRLKYDIIWQKKDLVMIDNKRFMHGRRAYEQGDVRKIINVQSLRANFAYGSTTRQN